MRLWLSLCPAVGFGTSDDARWAEERCVFWWFWVFCVYGRWWYWGVGCLCGVFGICFLYSVSCVWFWIDWVVGCFWVVFVLVIGVWSDVFVILVWGVVFCDEWLFLCFFCCCWWRSLVEGCWRWVFVGWCWWWVWGLWVSVVFMFGYWIWEFFCFWLFGSWFWFWFVRCYEYFGIWWFKVWLCWVELVVGFLLFGFVNCWCVVWLLWVDLCWWGVICYWYCWNLSGFLFLGWL